MKLKDIKVNSIVGDLLTEAVIKLQESTYLTEEEILDNLVQRARGRLYRFETFTGKNGEYYFRFVAPNNEIMVPSEGYKNRGDRMKSIEVLKREIPNAPIIEVDK